MQQQSSDTLDAVGRICRDRSVPPAKPALCSAVAPSISHQDLEALSCRVAHGFRSLGLRVGDHVAFMLETRSELFALVWGAQRCGLYFTLIPTHLQQTEVAYIVRDCAAAVAVTSARFATTWRGVQRTLTSVRLWLCADPSEEGFVMLGDWLHGRPSEPMLDDTEGWAVLYTSGTTGQPKGVVRPLRGGRFGADPVAALYTRYHGMDRDTVYLSPAPLHHAAPLRCAMAVQRLGGTVVTMDRFDPLCMLEMIAAHRVTHVQLVPTMLHRLLALPEELRRHHDLSSLRRVIHAAAPCPAGLKRAAIRWLGPILSEYYGGTEGAGMTYIDSPEWATHEGSVGRAISGVVHIVGPEGEELPTGQVGEVYFGDGPVFTYLNAPEKLAEVSHPRGWITLGDIGRLDSEGYLYLVDRKASIINSGGVKVYPAEVEAVLCGHPAVADVAVVGVPDVEFGEAVKAVVELRTNALVPTEPAVDLASELIEYCRARLSHVKCPRSVDFVAHVPRSEGGKLLREGLRARYRETGGLS